MLLSNLINGQEQLLLDSIDKALKEKNYRKITSFSRQIGNLKETAKQAQYINILAKSFENLNQEDSAFYYFKESLNSYNTLNDQEGVANLNLNIYLLLEAQNNLKSNKTSYFQANHPSL